MRDVSTQNAWIVGAGHKGTDMLTSADGWEKCQFVAVEENSLRRNGGVIDGHRNALQIGGKSGELASQDNGGIGCGGAVGQRDLQSRSAGAFGERGEKSDLDLHGSGIDSDIYFASIAPLREIFCFRGACGEEYLTQRREGAKVGVEKVGDGLHCKFIHQSGEVRVW